MSFDITKKSWYSCDGICVEIGIGESRKTEPCGDKCPPGWCLKEGMCLEEMASYENGSKIMANEGSINHHMRKRKRLWRSCHGRCHEVHHHCSKANNSHEKQQKQQLVAKNQSNMNHISKQSKNMANEDTLNDSHITKTHTNKTEKVGKNKELPFHFEEENKRIEEAKGTTEDGQNRKVVKDMKMVEGGP